MTTKTSAKAITKAVTKHVAKGKGKAKPVASSKTKASKGVKPKAAPAMKSAAEKPVLRPGSIRAKIIEAASQKSGATMEQLTKITGWAGGCAGTLKRSAKKAGLKIVTEKVEGKVTYFATAK